MDKEGKNTIAFFLPSFDGGGAERNVLNFIKWIDKKKYQITLILAQKEGCFLKEALKGISIVDLNTSSLFKILLSLIKYFRQRKPDIFVSTFPRFNLVNLLAKIFSQKKFNFVIVEQTTPSNIFITARKISHKLIAYFFLPSLIKIFYPKAQAIVCVSEGVKNDLCKFIDIPGRIRVIYNPVVEEKIYEMSKKGVGHPWFKNKEIPVVLAVGRLVKAKNYPLLLGAFALILKEKNARLVILGEGGERKNIEKISKKLGISGNVNLLGFQENPYKYLRNASVFVVSSSREGFSNVIIEAMACGVPIVSTDCAGPKEIIENNKNGILVPINDKRSLAEATLKILNNPSLAQRFSDEGKKRALDFTVVNSIHNYETLFQELLFK